MVIEKIRTFIAVNFNDDLKNSIRDFQSRLKDPHQNFVKWVDPESMHITLKFLGDRNDREIELLKMLLRSIASDISSFSLKTGQTGFFPNITNARIFWLGMEGSTDKLYNLVTEIEDVLAKEGFEKEKKSFTGHITIARLKDYYSKEDRALFTAKVKDVKFEPSIYIYVNHMAIMKSTLTSKGPIYTKLAEYKLKP